MQTKRLVGESGQLVKPGSSLKEKLETQLDDTPLSKTHKSETEGVTGPETGPTAGPRDYELEIQLAIEKLTKLKEEERRLERSINRFRVEHG